MHNLVIESVESAVTSQNYESKTVIIARVHINYAHTLPLGRGTPIHHIHEPYRYVSPPPGVGGGGGGGGGQREGGAYTWTFMWTFTEFTCPWRRTLANEREVKYLVSRCRVRQV